MAALLRGLRAGRVLRALSSGMVTPQFRPMQRGFRQAARLRSQDQSKSDQLNTTASSPSSSTVAHQQHLEAQPSEQETASAQETSAPGQTVPESVSTPIPEVEAVAPTPEVEAAVPTPEVEAAAPSVSAAERDVAESAPSPAATPAQEVPVSAPGLEESAHTPEAEAPAAEEGASAQAASEQEAPEPDRGPAEQDRVESDAEESDAEETDGEESDSYESEEELRTHILATALEFVPQHGWSVEAIAEAAQALGLSSAASGMFTNGAGDLVLHFIAHSNAQLAKMLGEHQNQVQQGQAEPKETAEFLRYAVEARLRMLIPHIDTWPQAMSILLLPHNIPNSLKQLSTLIDDIWYYAGDRSTDMNWYTRRAALTGVYNTTELVMLQDSSPDFQDTWVFLDNRIQDIVDMANTAKQVQATGEAVVQGIMGAAVTLSNLAGMNQRR